MKNKKAFTIAETMIAMVILGILGACALLALRPVNMKKDAFLVMGKDIYSTLNEATLGVLSKYSANMRMTKLSDLNDTEFSINDTGADIKLSALYKKVLKISRDSDVPSSYTSLDLQDEQNIKPTENIAVSYFTQGFKLLNGVYVAFKLFDNCDETIDYIYDPSAPDKRTVTKTCGLIFFDVNAQDDPNTLGIDQYIIAIGKSGIK